MIIIDYIVKFVTGSKKKFKMCYKCSKLKHLSKFTKTTNKHILRNPFNKGTCFACKQCCK